VPVYSLAISSAILRATFSGGFLRGLPASGHSFSISLPVAYSSRMILMDYTILPLTVKFGWQR